MESCQKTSEKNAKGEWLTRVILPEGEHQYKYIVDGNWSKRSGAVKFSDNCMGDQTVCESSK